MLRELSSASSPRTTNAFSWLKHARFYVEAGSELVVSIADGRFSYGWEYLGVIDRLVHTSLTERCIFLCCNTEIELNKSNAGAT